MIALLKTIGFLVGIALPAIAAWPWIAVLGGRRLAPAMTAWLAFPLGWAGFTVLLFLANAICKLPINLAVGLILLLVIGISGMVLHRRMALQPIQDSAPAPTPPPVPLSPWRRWLINLLLVLLLAWVTILVALCLFRAPDSIPALGIWGYKAMAIHDCQGIPLPLFNDSQRPYLHPGYPLAYPIIMAWGGHVAGGFDPNLIPLTPCLATILLAFGFVKCLREDGISLEWALLAPLGLVGGILTPITSAAYAEPLLLLCVLPGAWCWCRYLDHGDVGYLCLGSWLFAAGAWIKNEGLLIFCLAWLLLAILAGKEWRQSGYLGKALAAFSLPAALFIIPWLLFRLTLGIGETDFHGPLSMLGSHAFSFVTIKQILAALLNSIFLHPADNAGIWWLLPLILALHAKSLWQHRANRWTLALCLLIIIAYAAAFTVSTRRLDWHLRTFPRILLAMEAFTWMGLAQHCHRLPITKLRF